LHGRNIRLAQFIAAIGAYAVNIWLTKSASRCVYTALPYVLSEGIEKSRENLVIALIKLVRGAHDFVNH